MEDGGHGYLTAGSQPGLPPSGSNTPISRTPPPPPNPHVGPHANDLDVGYRDKRDEPLELLDEQWDITQMSGLGALRMFMYALEKLAEATGDVPPTPPVTRPSTPKRRDSNPVPGATEQSPEALPHVNIGSPEAHPHEPLIIAPAVVVRDAPDHRIQHAAIARRFFSKVAPPFSLKEYLLRFHQFCPHSPGVYLAAAVYCHRLCVSDYVVPATNRTIHRLSLAAIRIAAKSLEDNKWSQERVAKVGGVNLNQLLNLEITMLFLLDFDLSMNAHVMAHRMFALQQAASHGMGLKSKSDGFALKLPPSRRKTNQAAVVL